MDVNTLESSRSDQLQLLLSSLTAAGNSKSVELMESTNILSDLVDLRKRVSEDKIAIQLDSAIIQKNKLVELEQQTLNDINILTSEVEIDYKKALLSIASYESVLQSFPSEENNQGIRLFIFISLNLMVIYV